MRRSRFWTLIFKLISSIFVISLIIAAIFFLLRSDLFTIKQATCFVGKSACPGNYWTNLISLSLGRNIFILSSQSIEEEIEAVFPDIDEARIKKVFPDQLELAVELRKATAAIGGEDWSKEKMATTSAEFFIVDEEGVVFKKVDTSSDLPVILTGDYEALKVGQRVENKPLIQSITAVSLLSKLDLNPEIVKISKGEIHGWLKGGPEVIFSSEKEAAIQVGSLQLILSRTKIEGKSLKRIDLRFDKPIIVEK